MNNPFGKEHSDILFYFFNGALVLAGFFFFLWLKDHFKTLKEGVDKVAALCALRQRDCPGLYRSKEEANKDWQRLNGSLIEIKKNIEEMRGEIKEKDKDIWDAINNHGHVDGKVTRT